MTDVLAFEVPTFPGGGSKYPSVNGMWASGVRYGKKTPEYHDLFVAVREAAWAEVKRTGWETAADRVEVHLRRYVTNNRARDAANFGKCELDALSRWNHGQPCQGFPGVYVDDALVRPFLDVVIDPREGAVDRIAFAVFRVVLFGADRAPKRRRPAVTLAPPELKPHESIVTNGKPKSYRLPTLNGQPITMEKARELIEDAGSANKGRRR